MTRGAGIQVDVGTIERELAQLWRSEADAADDGEHAAVVRACLVNLIVWAPPGAIGDRMLGLCDDLSRILPARIVHVRATRVGELSGGASGVSAWISANCYLAPGGGKEICSEEVTLAASGESVDELPSVVLSLLASDVPTSVLVAGALPPTRDAEPALARIVRASDRLIVDSSRDGTAGCLGRLASLAGALAARGITGDLAWHRAAPWRMAVAEEFDGSLLGLAPRVTRLRIDVTRAAGGAGEADAMLMAGWVASRLDWRFTKARAQAHPAGADAPTELLAEFRAGESSHREATIRTRAGSADAAALASLEMDISAGEGAAKRVFRVKAIPGDGDIGLGIDTESETARVARFTRAGDVQLLAGELRDVHGEPLYASAFAVAREIAAAAHAG